jgi:hypothetical protein
VHPTFATIRDGLERLRTTKPPPEVFGSESHGFVLNQPLPAVAVRTFEADHRIRLPDDYRRFLTELGNGGAGPFYGLFKLGEMDDSFDFQKWREGDGFVGILSKPFPHTSTWNDLTGEPTETDGEDEYEAALEAFDQRYWSPDQVNGAIPICHEGCALRDWLVVNGTEAGHVWRDARTEQGGLMPVAVGGGKRVTFLDWYVDWLNSALARLPN